MWQSFKEYIPLSLGRWLGMVIGGIGAIGTIAQVIGYTLPNMPLWAWLLIMFFGFSIAQFLAFHKVRVQRNQARRSILAQRKVPLPNRESLIRVISIIKEKVIDLKMRQDDLNFKEKRREDPREELAERDNAWFAYRDARKDLETERLVAGDNFRAIFDNLMMFVDYHVDDCMNLIPAENKPETLKTVPFMTLLDNNIEQAIRDIDEISLQEHDKEGSQT